MILNSDLIIYILFLGMIFLWLYLLIKNRKELGNVNQKFLDTFKGKEQGHVVYELPKISVTNRIITEHHIIQEQTITIGDYDLDEAYKKYLLIRELNK